MNIAPDSIGSTRRTFLQNVFHFSLLFSATGISLLTAACSGGDNNNNPNNAPNGAPDVDGNCSQTNVIIQETHTPNHILTVSGDDVNAGAAKTYTLENNGSGHTHTITLTSEDFTMLKNNVGLSKTSTTDSGHSHQVTINCVT